MKPWKTNARKTILDEKPWLTVEQHTVELPNGRIIPNWPWIITPDYINIVAVTEESTSVSFVELHPDIGIFLSKNETVPYQPNHGCKETHPFPEYRCVVIQVAHFVQQDQDKEHKKTSHDRETQYW
jgi:hypothetical protein